MNGQVWCGVITVLLIYIAGGQFPDDAGLTDVDSFDCEKERSQAETEQGTLLLSFVLN